MSAPKISLSLSAASKTSTTPTGRNPTNGLKRPRSVALHDDDNDDDEDSSRKLGRAQRVSHFDRAAGGAIDAAQPRPSGPATLVIARQANRDWREAASARHRQRNGMPGAASAASNRGAGVGAAAARDSAAVMEDRRPQFGLTVAATVTSQRSGQSWTEEQRQGAGEEVEGAASAAARPQTEDERAIDALLGRTSTDRSLVLPQVQPGAMTEAEAFSHDFRDAPDMSTLDDYARVPVEQFGAALLRGMGWKDGEGIGSQRGKKIEKTTAKIPERRAALLGIGAKEDAAITGEMGAWGKAAKKGREVKIYNPVMLRDKRTGEMLTEEELQKKKDREEREKYEAEFDRKEKKKEVGRNENGDRRNGDDDRDRRRHNRDDESDDEYYRRKEKERRMRRDREDRNRDHDRDQSRRHRERNERNDDYGREHSRRHRDHDDRDKYWDHDRRREQDRRR